MNALASQSEATPANATEDGKSIPEKRVRDAQHGYSIYRNLQRDDEYAAWKRANIDGQIDMMPPFDEQVMIDANRGEDANVNFGEARSEDDNAQIPFIEMTTVARILWQIKTSYGTTEEQAKYSNIISEEHTRTMREWGGDFDYYRIRLAQQFQRHGVAFAYWEDETDWKWRVDGLETFKIPRNIEAREGAIPYLTCERNYTVDELYRFIRDEESVKELKRWNYDAVKEAVLAATPDTQGWQQGGRWEEWMRRYRENDLMFTGTCKRVKVYHLWLREFNGCISHYIGLTSGPAAGDGDVVIGNGWLYAHESRFKKLENCIIPFFYGVGTHGTTHTVRGVGELNFAPIAISNRALCKGIDCAGAASSILLQASTPNDAANTAYIQMGPFMIVSGNSKIEPTAMPDVSSRLLPIRREMQMLRQNVTGSFQARAITEEGAQERTKYEVQAQQQQGGTLDSARMTLFLGPWSRMGKESYRRMMNPDLSDRDAGGPEALDFRKRCMLRGVPSEALDMVYSVEAVRSIGYGSPQTRQYSSDQIFQMSGSFDEVGRRRATLDRIAALPGVDYQQAEYYVGPEEPRLTIDDQIAEMENALFRQGQEMPVVDGQNSWVHAQHHLALVDETVAAFEQGQIDGATLVPILSTALANTLAHSEQLNKDPMRQKEAAYVRKQIQENNGTLQQQEQKLIAEMQRASEEQMAAQGEEPMDGEEEREWQAHEQEMAIKEREFFNRNREFEQKLALQNQEAQLRNAAQDLKLQSDLATKRAKLLTGAAA